MKNCGINTTGLKLLYFIHSRQWHLSVLSLRHKWSTVPFTRALKYYIPLGDISIVAWPSSLKRGGVWDVGRTGASVGTEGKEGTRFRHDGGVEKLLLPDGITST